MSNIHALQDEANKHTAKGFDLVGNNTRPWKDEKGQQNFTENNELPRAINFVDGTAAAPTSVDGDIYVLIGSGTIHADWGASTFGDWARAFNTIYTPITPVKGMLCYDDTGSTWMEFDGTIWAAHVSASTNLSEGTSTTTTVDVDSDTGTNATLQPASTIRAGVMSSAKFDEVELNNAKVSDIDHNATHTGEVLGSGVLTVDATAVSNKALITATGTMEVLVNDAGTLKKVVASDFLGGGVSDADYGDITVTASGATWTVDNDVVTFAKMQNIATDKILGRSTAGSGDVEELTISNDLKILLGVIGLNTTPLYISDITTVNLLDDVSNWDLNGNYTGTFITGTFQGQNHYNSTYKFECVHDNVWIRIARVQNIKNGNNKRRIKNVPFVVSKR